MIARQKNSIYFFVTVNAKPEIPIERFIDVIENVIETSRTIDEYVYTLE